MADLNQNSFTIRISENPDGTLEVWSKGMPDTRSFGGQPVENLPKVHRLGLFALGQTYAMGESLGWVLPKTEEA